MFLLKGSRGPRRHIGRAQVTTRSHRPSYFRPPRKRRLFGSSPWASPEVTGCTNTSPDTTPNDDPRSPQANLRRYEAAMGEVEGKVRAQEGQKPSCNECRCQEEAVGVDEGALGCEEKGEGLVQGLNSANQEARLTLAFRTVTISLSRTAWPRARENHHIIGRKAGSGRSTMSSSSFGKHASGATSGQSAVPEPSFAERARTLMHLGRIGSLSTLSRKQPGFPFGSLMPYALDDQGRPIFLVSTMACIRRICWRTLGPACL